MTAAETSRPVCPVRFVDDGTGAPVKPVIDLDPYEPSFAQQNYQVYDELLQQCPVAWSTGVGGFWLMTGYQAVFEATQDDYTFISSAGTGLGVAGGEHNPETSPIPIEIDPPDTMAYRKVAIGILSPASIARIEPDIRRVANELIDKFIETGLGDLVRDLSTPLPAIMILRILGMDESRWPEWVSRIHAMIHGGGSGAMDAAMELGGEIAAELMRRAESGEHPGDLLDLILTSPVNGAPMPLSEQVRYVLLALLGGMDTTSGLTGNSLIHIARSPELRQKLIDNRDLMKQATEEFLRHDTPTQGLARTLSKDVEFYGQRLKKGEKVMLMWAAANRDPSEFPDPESIDIERAPNRHMAFGVGLHRCLGSNLARTMFRVMIDEILNRLPDFQISVDQVPRFEVAVHVYAPASLPVRFTPGPRKYPATAS
jgi:cytochrome P450